MLKKSDFVYMMLSFFAIIAVYLIISENLSMNTDKYNHLEPINVSQNDFGPEKYLTEDASCMIVCGNNADSENTKNIITLLSQIKMEYSICSRIDEISRQRAQNIEIIIITAKSWEEIGDKDRLIKFAEKKGKNLIFTGILEDESGEYNKKIGILEKGGLKNIQGIMVFGEMFVQGMVYYDKMNLDVTDVKVDARCKKLVIERTKKDVEQKDLTPLIWKKIDGKGCYYVINGEFLTLGTGMGILTGILSEIQEDFVYPVVNAKVCLLDSFPELDNPYEQEIARLYSRNTNMFIRDIVWPSVVKTGQVNNLIFSTRLTKPVTESTIIQYGYLKKMMQKWQCEIEENVEESDVTFPFVCAGHMRNSTDTFHMQSSISGQGFSAQYLDMSEIMGKNAEDSDYEWSKYSLELSKKMYDLYQNTDWIDALVLSEARERYKRYLILKPVIVKTETEIKIGTENFHDMCFYIIRTDKEVLKGDGYEEVKIGENAYLIKVLKDSVTVPLEKVKE